MIKPHSSHDLMAIKAENDLLGSLIVSPQLIDIVSQTISGEMFADVSLGVLYQTLVDMRNASHGIDSSLVMAELNRRANKKGINSARLAELIDGVPHGGHAVYYSKQVLESHRRRRAFEIASEMSVDAQNSIIDISQTFETTVSKIENVNQTGEIETKTFAEASSKFLDELKKEKRTSVCHSGLRAIDEHTLGGMMPGEMIVLAARPGCGKTSLAWQICKHNAFRGRNVLFVSLEMRSNELVARTAAGATTVPSSTIRSGNVSADQMSNIESALDELADYPLSIADPATATMEKIKALSRLEKSRRGLQLLVIDYLGLIRHENTKLRKFESMTEISADVKRLAKEIEVPILALCQLNRESDGAEPKLSHLRDSGSIEQDADSVMFLHPEDDKKENFFLIVAKNRHGDTGKVEVQFDAQRTMFTDSTYEWSP